MTPPFLSFRGFRSSEISFSALFEEIKSIISKNISRSGANYFDKCYNGSVMNKDKVKLPFKVGQVVVYPGQGLGKIESLDEKSVGSGKPKSLYYKFLLLDSDSTILLPAEKSKDLGVRSIVSKKKSESILKEEFSQDTPLEKNWKERHKKNLELFQEGALQGMARIVSTLYRQSKIKPLSSTEDKLYKDALSLLTKELSYSLKKKKEDVEKLIFLQLEAS